MVFPVWPSAGLIGGEHNWCIARYSGEDSARLSSPRLGLHMPHDWKEWRRLRAWELHEQGWRSCAIAQTLGVSPGAVSQWFSRATTAGPTALYHHASPGAPPKLTTEQKAQIPALLEKGAEAYGFRGNLWTGARVASVLARTFQVHYHPAHISRILRRLGWSVQKPVRRASQRDEQAIQAWAQETWPRLKKKPGRKAAPSSSSTNLAST